MSDTIVLYHYTTKQGKKAIINSRLIKESRKAPGKGDATFGNGVYLTSLDPTCGKVQLYLNNFDGAVSKMKFFDWGKSVDALSKRI